MLDRAIRPVRIADGPRLAVGHQPEMRELAQQRDIAGIAQQRRMLGRAQQHEVLDREFDIDHAAPVVLEIEQCRAIRVTFEHAVAHRDDLLRKRQCIATLGQHLRADRLELFADPRVAACEARA